jgi:hydroxypyruvate reductase
VASVGTDGVDGPTDTAGACADETTVARARRLGLEPERFLQDNDSHTFFRSLGDLIVTGPTGTNVGDLQVCLAGARR